MRRAAAGLILLAGWLLVGGAAAAPIIGMMLSLLDPARVTANLVKVPSPARLMGYSITVSAVATAVALLLGTGPAGFLGLARTRLRAAVVIGVCLAPLLIPPQVYAYAWGLATAPDRLLAAALPSVGGVSAWGSALRAGILSAAWLWPLVTLIVAAGCRSTASGVYTLALLDTSPFWAFWRGVLPSLRAHLLAAVCVVFIIATVEYPIPHLSLARTYATELLLLIDVGAPPGQVVWTALPAIGLIAGVLMLAALAMRSMRRWGAVDPEASELFAGPVGWSLAWLAVLSAATVGIPVAVMAGSLRIAARWREAFTLLSEEWLVSCGVSLAAAGAAVLIAIATVVWAAAGTKRPARRGVSQIGLALGALAAFGALVPGAALGIGFVTIYNRAGIAGDLYSDTPVVWTLSLAARYAVVPLLVAWLSLRRHWLVAVEQARVDGAGSADILLQVMLPMLWPSLLAGGLIVALLSLSEVVISQLVRPVGYPSIALTILGLMHYGRDDTVIIASLLIVLSGVIIAQLAAWLLLRRQ